jgi:PQQ-dependent dehydrogenase (methanol/ethanol family)
MPSYSVIIKRVDQETSFMTFVPFSMTLRRLAILAAAVGSVASAQSSRQVDDALLKSGSKTGEEWISYGVNWSEQRYSPLNQINATNISRLGLAWSYDIPVAPGNFQAHQEATPLVFNGVLYSITPWSIVYAVDLKTGKEIWRSDPEVIQQVWQSRICCGVVNRGIALYQGKVIAPAVDGRLRALDQATGKILWETRVSPENMAYSITMAPRVIKGGKVVIGVSGGEYAIRGFFAAFDVNTGKQAWKFYTVPGDPSKPFEQPELAAAAKTWSNDWWKIGGGAAVWNGFAYDSDNDIVYVGTGQPGPWTDFSRGTGDNLYANCILAVKGATGKLVWYYQEVPGDDWDFDSIADLMLVDLKIDGKNRKVILHSPKDGFFYVLDRVTGELLSADPITKINWATGIDPKTGKPNVNPAARYGKDTVKVLPGPSGGHVWPPWSYSPLTGLVYIPGTAGGSYNYQADPNFVPQPTDIGPTGRGLMNMGTGRGAGGGQLGRGAGRGAGGGGRGGNAPDALPDAVQAATPAAGAAPGAGPGTGGGPAAAPAPAAPAALIEIPAYGPDGPTGNVLYAWDPIAKKERWRVAGAGAGPFAGGTLATAGNLVLDSVNDRLMIFRADTGEKLTELNCSVTQMGPPISFMIDGKQYISVTGAPGGAAGGGRGAADGPRPPAKLWVFALDGKLPLPGTSSN